MWNLRIYTLLVVTITTNAQLTMFDCPLGWEDFEDHCYRFIAYPELDQSTAKSECLKDGAFLLSVNSDVEHRFVEAQLNNYDPGQRKRSWWTSGRRLAPDKLEFFWEGDGQKVESYFYWRDPSIPEDTTLNIIMYDYDGYQSEWNWILGRGTEISPFVCKISKEDIYKIELDERGRDYGIESTDIADVPFGPVFVLQPQDVIYEPLKDTGIVLDQTSLECRAEANPLPSYRWFKTRGGEVTEIMPLANERYTFIGGKLVIDKPAIEREDDGGYQCWGENEYGAILSNTVQLSFGYLQDFPKSPRSPVSPVAYTWVSIECNPPSHYPAVTYSWYKNSPDNYVQTSLKPYIFISNNGRLYFSEVTQDDVGDYYCVVTRTGTNWNSGVTSMPTKLNIKEGSPGVYEPNIPDEFPYVYPENPKIGDNIRIECWASGTSRPQLEYHWRKVELREDDSIDREIPLPNQVQFLDHNRILNIPNVTLYDAGVYVCSVTRPYGRTTERTKTLYLQAVPYYVLPLKDIYEDVGKDLSWRCEADGIPSPSYIWYKNGEELEPNISPEDEATDRVVISNNVLTIKSLDATKDDGMYQCAARNIHATRYSSAELKVLALAPSFFKYPLQANQFATNQGNTTIICRAEAAPAPDITWFKNGGTLTTSERVLQMPNGNLYISPVQKSDAGVYKCHASNTFGEAESTGNLTILDTVTISRPPEGETIPVGQARMLHCTASYNPLLDITYTWFHSGVLIEFERVYRLGENQYVVWKNPYYERGTATNYGGLLIKDAQQEHEGQYTCYVETSVGDDFTRHAEVKIVGPPWEPAGVDIRDYDISTVTFRWKKGGNNGGTIISYVIETYNHWEKFWRIAQTNLKPQDYALPSLTDTYEMTLTKLRPFSTYQIRIRAENVYGTSVPSEPSGIFVLGSVKPDLYPENIGGGGGKIGELRVTWTPMDPWEENGPGFGYKFFWRLYGEPEFAEKVEIIHGNANNYSYIVGHTNFYRLYEVALQAYNNEGLGPLSPIARIRSAMALPKAIATNVRAQPYNATACRVTWEPVSDNREDMQGQLGGYKVAYWPEEVGPDLENAPRVTYNGQMSEGMVIGLDPNRQYYFAVYVWNEAGNGPKSQWFLQRTLRNAPINQPVEVKVFRKGSEAIHVYWRGVSTTQIEEPLEGYKVRLWVYREDIKFAHDYNARKENDMYIEGLHPDVTYKLRVFGYSRGGDGTMSSPAVVFMLGAASHIQVSLLVVALPVLLSLWRLFAQ